MATERFLRIDELKELIGCCQAKIYLEMKNGDFPKPVKLFGKRASAWVASEVHQWMQSRISERDRIQTEMHAKKPSPSTVRAVR